MARVRTLFCELKQNNISDKIKPQYNVTNWPLYRSSLRVKIRIGMNTSKLPGCHGEVASKDR